MLPDRADERAEARGRAADDVDAFMRCGSGRGYGAAVEGGAPEVTGQGACEDELAQGQQRVLEACKDLGAAATAEPFDEDLRLQAAFAAVDAVQEYAAVAQRWLSTLEDSGPTVGR